uniref:Uncharacterized protein n=1 Tax=Cannabis sativa TaxID=3483 RepID=A0A803QQ68_CANSA
MEEVEEVSISDEDPTRTIRVGRNLPLSIRENIINTIRRNQDVLAWSYLDMTGIDRNTICHAFNIREDATPVHEKGRLLDLVRAKVVKVEVDKLIAKNFFWEALYLAWLANPVLVLKPNGS